MERSSNHPLPTGPAEIPSWRIPKPLSGSSWEIPPGFRDNRGSNDVSLFSSSLPVFRHEKSNFADANPDADSSENALTNLNQRGKEAKGKVIFDDLEVQGIGSLLPDDEDDLLAGVTDDFDLSGLPNQVEDLDEDDVFGSGGGLELDSDPLEFLSVGLARTNINDGYIGNGATHYAHPVGTIVGEHPYGEHPSRTLFVRNINSNVDDTELRSLFEQYGDIRTLYTACKHRGFVMISYYDIRDARSAMRGLQNKPLRRRKLDIHFSIPKENPSDKDINQGTLVVFNLDSSVSNDDLRQIFGEYGEVKEIRETPHKRHHKFVEFYDVRAAEAALRALNRSDIAGKRIKLEPSRPGGARRNLMQQLNQDVEQDETRSFRHQAGSPIASSPPGIWAQFSNAADNSSLQPLNQSPTLGPINSFSNKSSPGLASILPSLSNSVRIPPIGKDLTRNNYLDRAFGYGNSTHGTALQQSHSFPEKGTGDLPNLGSSPGTMSSFGHSTTGSSGIGTLTGPQFLWGSPTSDQSRSSAWKASPSLGHSFTSNGERQGFAHSSHENSYIASAQSHLGHHAGSAPSGNLLERRFGYFPETSDVPFMGPVPFGIGFSQNEGHLMMNINARGPMNPGAVMSGQVSEMGASGFRMMPSQRMGHMVLGGSVYPIPSFSLEGERARRRVEASAGQFDSKKQYQLELDKIKSGEDIRTTLMIKNIPNKYTAKMLLCAIDEKHKGMYDFFYLPIDFKNKCNVGYAFINMVSALHIIPFYQTFNGKKWDKFNSEKVASLAYARIQGKAALISHFQNSSLMNEDKRCRPILFHYEGADAGDLEPFPLPLGNVNFEVRQQDGPSLTEMSASPPNNLNKNKEKNQAGSNSEER